MKNLPLAKDSIPYLIVTTVLTVALFFVSPYLFIPSLILTLFIAFFFRNPYRKLPTEDNIIVSPADGRVMSISEIEEDTFIKGKAIKVTIFLSLFNVHINRSPIEGTVDYKNYRAGKYLPAFKSHASEINERNTIGIQGNNIKVLVHQITGFIARRIVCWVDLEDKLTLGERFGMIKFGSCTEIVVPLNVDIKVKPGDKVKGAKTIIGIIA
jgi:phosphatidylserine decarboxylase